MDDRDSFFGACHLSVLGATCSNRVNEKQADVLEAERQEEGSGTDLNSG